MYGRIKQSYISKKYLEIQGRKSLLSPPNLPSRLKYGMDFDSSAFLAELEEEFSSSTLSSDSSSHEFGEVLENFAKNPSANSEQIVDGSTLRLGIRTSYDSMQSLRRRMNDREARAGQNLREYSDEELSKYIFLKRLSIGSLPSHRSTTSSLFSKRRSDSVDFSVPSHLSPITVALMQTDDDLDYTTLPFNHNEVQNSSNNVGNLSPSRPLRHVFEARRPIPASMKKGISRISEPAMKFTRRMTPSLSRGPQQSPDFSRQRIVDVPIFRVEGFPYVGPVNAVFDNLDLPSGPDVNNTRDSSVVETSRSFVLHSSTPDSLERSLKAGSGPYSMPGGHSSINLLQAQSDLSTSTVPCRPLCCVISCRGDPRADKCPYCIYEVPKAHNFIRLLVEQRITHGNVEEAWENRPDNLNFCELDDFGDTILHLAASLGAGSLILSWLISTGISVHAKNVVGQTFMHVLNPAGFALCGIHDLVASGYSCGDTIAMLLDTLKEMDFDFSAEDDFGQTPMHVLTQYEIHSHTMELAIKAGMSKDTSFSTQDFLGRSIEQQMRIQSFIECNWLVDPQREFVMDLLLHDVKPSIAFFDEQGEKFLTALDSLDNKVSHFDAVLRATAFKAASGSPEIRFRGGNGLHFLAESCIRLWIASENRVIDAAQRKRKRQAEASLSIEPTSCVFPYIIDMVEKLLKLDVDPNQYDNHGNTPLMAFIGSDLSPTPDRKLTANVLQLLIDSGANVSRRNRRGETALHLAMRFGCISAVEVLLKNHANVHARARHGDGIVAVAAKASHRAKRDGALYHQIITCMAIAGKYGAVLGPSTKDEWDQQKKLHQERRPCND